MLRTAYCSNVHAGSNLGETRQNLSAHALAVRELVSPTDLMGIGLWLSAKAAEELCGSGAGDELDDFAAFLSENMLDPFTFNGFPFGDFHQKVVKKDVYDPNWFQPARADYTHSLIQLIQKFSTSNELSISTLPIAWGNPSATNEQLNLSARLLAETAELCRRIEADTGRLIHVCVEPEPGCQIQFSQDIVDFFESHLLGQGDEETLRRHIRVCHDVCHAVVMCESQADVFAKYHRAGIEVGKVQVSSAIVVEFDAVSESDRADAVSQISAFAEDRYLHQTTVQSQDGAVEFYEDLPLALRSISNPRQASGTWRIHFHVPIHLREFGLLSGSQDAIKECLTTCREFSDVLHFEVETYAWNVLPLELQEETLAVGIAKEMLWFHDLAERSGLR